MIGICIQKIKKFFFNRGNGEVRVATPIDRFLAFLIDSFIIYSVISVFIFLFIKKDLSHYAVKNNEVSFSIDSKSNITNLKNITVVPSDNGEKSLRITPKSERIDNFNKIVNNKIFSNSKVKYFIFLFPIFYNVIYLLSKRRATIGQQLFGLMIIKVDGTDLNFNDIINRVFLFTMCKIIFFAPFTILIPLFFSKDKITIYDKLTKTYVIKI